MYALYEVLRSYPAFVEATPHHWQLGGDARLRAECEAAGVLTVPPSPALPRPPDQDEDPIRPARPEPAAKAGVSAWTARTEENRRGVTASLRRSALITVGR
jgi:hypothetical protein